MPYGTVAFPVVTSWRPASEVSGSNSGGLRREGCALLGAGAAVARLGFTGPRDRVGCSASE
ncbi:hypothetical protein PV723_07195 [Streptomyces sp. AK04-3B]|nr:hypothetical protein [Streptomyces sp. AK04-3B]